METAVKMTQITHKKTKNFAEAKREIECAQGQKDGVMERIAGIIIEYRPERKMDLDAFLKNYNDTERIEILKEVVIMSSILARMGYV